MLRKELGRAGRLGHLGGAMTTETSVETLGAPAVNGGREAAAAAEAKPTVLSRDDTFNGRLQIRGSGQVLGNFTGQVEFYGDLFIGPEAHCEADIKNFFFTIAGLVRANIVAVRRL